MRSKWDEMNTGNKLLIVIRIILSVIVVILAAFQLAGIWERAIDYAVPILGVYLFVLSFQEWKQKRGSAILSICLSIFIFIVSFIVWFGK